MATRLALVILASGLGGEIASTDDLGFGNATLSRASLSAPRVFTLPDTDGILAIRDGNNSFSANQTVSKASATLKVEATSGAALHYIDSIAGTTAQVVFSTAGVNRWSLRKSGDAESGSDAGSVFVLEAYSDAGASLGNVFTIPRNTRAITLVVAPVFVDQAGTRTNLGATTVGGNLFTLANPGAIRFLRINADNTVTARSDSELRTDLSLGTAALVADNTLVHLAGSETIPGAKTFTANATVSANLLVDAGSVRVSRTGATGQILIDVEAGQGGQFLFRTGTSARWIWNKLNNAESGSNAGSDLQLLARDDAGAGLHTVLAIVRSTGIVTFSGSPIVPTPAAGDNSTKACTTAGARLIAPNNSYRNLFERESSHTAARANGTYAIASGAPAPISATGTLAPWGVFYFDPADYPTIDGLTLKLRVRGQVSVNDTAPAASFVIALHPVTHTGATGGAGLQLWTISAAVASSAATTVTTPAADSTTQVVGSDFSAPVAGWYCLGFVQSGGAIAANSHLHIAAQLQMRNT